MPESPYEPPKEVSSQDTQRLPEDLSHFLRALSAAHIAAAAFTATAIMGAYFYAWWHDPWMTPRFSPTMSAWYRVRATLDWLPFPLLLGGIALLVYTRKAWRRFVVLIAAIIFLAMAQWLCWLG